MAIIKDFFIDQGSTFAAELTVTDLNGQPFNLTGCEILSDIRKWHDSETAVASISCTISDNPINGKIFLSLSDEETSEIPARRYVYDVIIRNSADQLFRVAEGLVVVTPGVTRAF